MSDKELIIRFLERAERRTRRNRRFNDVAAILCISLLIPVTFKLLDLIFLFRGTTVSVFLGVWTAATAGLIYRRVRGRHTLSQIAANVDRRANLNDQMKTAYWFIRNPRPSEWVDAQIGRTAQQTGQIKIDALYPRRYPRTSLIAAGLLFMLFALNFIPLSLNHNWVYLQAAPPFGLTDDERHNLEQARKLLEQAKALENSEIVAKIQEIIDNLEQGDITVQEAIKQLEQLQQELEDGNLDLANMSNGLEEIAAILRQAKPLEPVARSLGRGDLTKAAQDVRDFSQRLQSLSAAELQDTAERFQQASENPRSSLENLARSFANTASAMMRSDRTATQAALDRVARELETLMQQIQDQRLRSDASEELGELAESLQQRENEGEGGGGDGAEPGSEGESADGPPGAGERGGQPQQGEGEAAGEAGEEGEAGEGGEAGESSEEARQGQAPGEGQNGKGGNSFGGSKESAPLEGELTSLEVQLKEELLAMEANAAAGKQPGKEETAGERERSKLDYRSVPSDLSPAQKDLLNQDRIPWESRQLIKNYFQAVKPQQTK